MKVIQLSNAEFLPHVTGLVAEGHDVSIRAKGQSMRPFIESERDVAVLSKEEAFEVGDVVLAEIEPGHYVLHRIDKIEDANGKVVKGKTKDADAKVTLRGDGNVPNPVNGGVEHCELRDIRALCSQVVRKGKDSKRRSGPGLSSLSFFTSPQRSRPRGPCTVRSGGKHDGACRTRRSWGT